MMKKHSFAVLAGLCAVLAFSISVQAGVEPSPFKEIVNKLNAVVDQLKAVDLRVAGLNLNRIEKGKSVNNASDNRLEAITEKLGRLESRVKSIYTPDGEIPEDVGEALGAVREGAAQIVSTVSRQLESHPDLPRETAAGFLQVQTAAQSIVNLIDSWIVR
ncbi:hypothetical protein JW948_03210 [bacterium]|nr:hypothetical protein [bacterium]